MPKRVLTPEDKAMIVSAPEATPTRLAELLGRPFAAVAQFRSRVQRAGGWYTPLTMTVCRECGRPFLTSRQWSVHADCKVRRARRQRAESRARVRRRDTDVAPADPRRRPWAPEEDRLILAHSTGLRELAAALGRTRGAVTSRRSLLRLMPTGPVRAGRLTDEELATLSDAPPDVANSALARQLGRSLSTVAAARRRIRRAAAGRGLTVRRSAFLTRW